MNVLDQLNTALDGRYQVEREIGAGGMATVYLARDLRHGRNVALKVLNPELGAVLGVERFLSEIRVTANLQHPNLLPLFDSGDAEGMLFYVMPYVEGQSLRARLELEKQLPVDEALHIATAVAGALDYAHQRGVIHRDLKPENILLQSGEPVVADFGIALAISRAGGQRVTQTGISLGTPHYMSPEQATGDRQIDARSDIYSLGAVLYEMLVGEPPHTGTTAQAVIARLLTDKPRPARTLRDTVPEHVDRALERALAKLPADRFHTANEFAQALTGARSVALPSGVATPGSIERDMRISFSVPTRRLRAAAPWIAVMAFAALAAWTWRRGPTRADPTFRFRLQWPDGLRIDPSIIGNQFAISPDGGVIIFLGLDSLGTVRLYRRPVDALQAQAIDGTNAARNPVFSPDGQWIAFVVNNELRKIPAEGGTSVTLGPVSGAASGLSWTDPDTIIAGGVGLRAFPAAGGPSRQIVADDSSRGTSALRWPLALPDRETVIASEIPPGGGSASTLVVTSMRTGRLTRLGLPGTAPIGYIDGLLFFGAPAGGVLAVPFDARSQRVKGAAIPVAPDVLVEIPGATKAALSRDGDLVYQTGQAYSMPVLYGADRSGVPVINEPRLYGTPRYSPDGQRIAVAIGTAQAMDVWIYDVKKGTLARLTTEGVNMRPEWTADGTRVLYRSERPDGVGIWWQPSDGSGKAELLFKAAVDPFEGILSPDGKRLIYRTSPGAQYSRDIFYVDLPDTQHPVPLVQSPYAEEMPRLSPDGRWMAYESEESGQFEIYVRPFPGPGARTLVSVMGGTEPLWSRDGRTLFYRSAQRLVAVTVRTTPTFSIGERSVVLEGDFIPNASHQNYDVAPDGQHFLMLKRAGDESQTIFVHNWLAEAKRLVAAKR